MKTAMIKHFCLLEIFVIIQKKAVTMFPGFESMMLILSGQ
jgi:hypothetical protein